MKWRIRLTCTLVLLFAAIIFTHYQTWAVSLLLQMGVSGLLVVGDAVLSKKDRKRYADILPVLVLSAMARYRYLFS